MNVFTHHNKKRLLHFFVIAMLLLSVMVFRLFYIMVVRSKYYGEAAVAIQERERSIKAPRGLIYDRNGVILAGNKAVCSISVIHSRITDEEKVIKELSERLDMDEAVVRKKVAKVSSREKIKSNVDKDVADEIRDLDLAGVMVDDDYKRYYPYSELASKVIGFTGADNQGIVGIEVEYDKVLMGTNGSINTLTDANGIEIPGAAENRKEPVMGDNLVLTLDVNIQMYIEQAAMKVMKEKNANRVCVIVMNPQNGEIYGMADVPGYNLNEPFKYNKSDKTTN